MYMNRIRTILGLLILLVGGTLLSSCTKNDENTIVLIGTESYIDDILSVIPSELQTSFFADFGNVPKGPVPPKIEGSYVIGPKIRVSSNVAGWVSSVVEPNAYLRFSKQHNGLVKMELAEYNEILTDSVFVCGNGKDFCVYFIEDKAYEMQDNTETYQMRMKRGVLIKGMMAASGIADIRYATVILDTEDGSNGLFPQYENGSYFIYKDGNNVAGFFEW